MARQSQLFLLSTAAVICLIATTILSAQVFLKLGELRTAQNDNIQWTVAKLEVEHARYINAVERLSSDIPESLQSMRRQFDILYSRVNTIATATSYKEALSSPRSQELVTIVSGNIDAQVAIIDRQDAQVFARKGELLALAEELTTPLTRLSSMGIAYDTGRRESHRETLNVKLMQLVILSLAFLATLFALLALFWQLYRRYRRRAMQNRTTLNRLATIINTSQDAIVVIAPNGDILEGNRVAHAIFGLPHDPELRKDISEILCKADENGVMNPVTAEMLINSCATGPNLCTKLSAHDKTGRTFPIELSANMASRSGDNVCVCFLRDISLRVATEAEMKAARDKAVAGERAKARFLGMVSHEMRTPLNGILGALDLLDETDLTPEQVRYTQIMQSSGQLVLNQINDALDITQADSDRLSLVSNRFDLDDLLDDLIQGQQAQAAAQNTRIRLIRSEVPLGPALGDQNRLHQVLLNILSNAIKFTRDGEVTIEVTRQGAQGKARGEVEFQISDTGVGIAEDDLSRIFEDFVRLKDDDGVEGTGLGLGIARHLVTLMGGTIGAESVRGEGSLFWIRLPLPRARNEDKVPAQQDIHRFPARACKVLVVEDNDTSRFVLNEMLLKDGHDIVLTSNGADAVTEAEQTRFDVILMDINMPGIDGFEATRRIRSGSGASRDSRIVVLTAHFRPEDNQRFDGIEIDGICTKPLRRAVLRDILSGGSVRQRPTGPHYGVDIQVLDQLCAVLPPKNLNRVLKDFFAEGQAFIDRLDARDGLARPGFAAELHQFAGSAATFGAVALQSALCRAESAANTGDKEVLSQELDALPELWRTTLIEIDSHRFAA